MRRCWPSRRSSKSKGHDSAWNRFVHQELQGYSPIITGNRVLAFFLVATIILIPLGAAILAASLSVTEYKVRYDNVGTGLTNTDKPAQQQALWASEDNGITSTVFMYYELQSYYQNHKRYVRSLVSAQLGGENKAPDTLGQCAPQQWVDNTENLRVDGVPLPDKAAIDPCGLMAFSYFNDSFSLASGSGAANPIPLDDSNIAWSSDRNSLYGHYNSTNFNEFPQYRGGGGISGYVNDDQHFLVWMRPGAARTVRKLYAQINSDIPAGTIITATVQNRYNTYAFGGSKSIILSTNSWVGGHNNALGGIMVTIGGLAFITAIVFFCSYHLNKKRRAYADPNYLSWNRTNLVH